MKTYARIETGAVAELLRTAANPAELFHPALRWVEVADPRVAVGWAEGPAGLIPPPPPAPVADPPPPAPTLAGLQARLDHLEAELAALRPR